MKWYIRVNNKEVDPDEAIKILGDIKIKNWKNYLILPGETGFNILRSLEEILMDPNHFDGSYQVLNEKGVRLGPTVSISGKRASFRGILMIWSTAENVSSVYYRNIADITYIKNFGFNDPILIKCP